MNLRAVAFLTALVVACTLPALAWGRKGHTIINRLAAQGLRGRVPAFLTTPSNIFEIAFLGPQEDRIKGAGSSWDDDYDPAHYLDMLDNGTIGGVVKTNAMPKDRERYDAALHAAGTDQYHQGYLPYSILDGWEQLRADFSYWRAYDTAQTAQKRAVMERIIARDIGVWGHFIADGSQPLHVTVHFNGWGNFPNPNGFTQSRKTHEYFEATFVNRYVTQAEVAADVPAASTLATPTARLAQGVVMREIMRYLRATNQTVPQLYAIQKRGGFAHGSKEAVAFTASRLAAGAAELRNLIVWAWQDSAYVHSGDKG